MESVCGDSLSGTSAQILSSDDVSTTVFDVTVVLPVHNERENIKALCLEIIGAMAVVGHRPSILLVDDGSTDGSLAEIKSISAKYGCISFVAFSRNFGKEAAIMAGLREAGDDFDVLAYMDSDGQHDPADLIAMLDKIRTTDAQMVCGARVNRAYQTDGQRWLVSKFYKLFHMLSESKIEEGVGDFNVLRPQVVNTIRELKEERIFMKGLIAWVGYKAITYPITIRPRAGGSPKSSTRKMFSLAFGALLSFSSWPLRVWSIIGVTSALLALAYLVYIIMQTALTGREVPGFATTVVLILGIGGVQLFSVGILGEYVARIYDASKGRPLYIVSERG